MLAVEEICTEWILNCRQPFRMNGSRHGIQGFVIRYRWRYRCRYREVFWRSYVVAKVVSLNGADHWRWPTRWDQVFDRGRGRRFVFRFVEGVINQFPVFIDCVIFRS